MHDELLGRKSPHHKGRLKFPLDRPVRCLFPIRCDHNLDAVALEREPLALLYTVVSGLVAGDLQLELDVLLEAEPCAVEALQLPQNVFQLLW